MALRIHDLVEWGELFNTRKNSVHGLVQLRGMEVPINIDLTGNCDPDLAGWHIRFEPTPDYKRDDDHEIDVNMIQAHQIGVPGNMTAARLVKHFDCSIKEFLVRANLGEPPPTRWVRSLYLEWYSQNGRVVLELPDPEIEFVERVDLTGVPMTDEATELVIPPDDWEPDAGNLEITSLQTNDEGETEIRRDVYGKPAEDETCSCRGDEYGLIPPEVQRILDRQSAAADRAAAGIESDEDLTLEDELMDALIESDCDIPICSIFDEPMRLPAWQDLDERKADLALRSLLTQLAMLGIAFHMCEHFTSLEAYRLLVEKVLWEGRAYPQLRGTGWVTNFMTSEWCEKCRAEMEREFEEMDARIKKGEAEGLPVADGLPDADSIDNVFPNEGDPVEERDSDLPF
jgi:hypothetical protein